MSLHRVGHQGSHSAEAKEPSQRHHARRYFLASQSPRRAQLVKSIGLDCDVGPSGVDDATLDPGRATPASWVMALAYLKATAGVHTLIATLGSCPYDVVLGADTVCELDGAILGQPEDAEHAARMIHAMVGRSHAVLSGLALVCPSSGQRSLYCDTAIVTVGELCPEQIRSYVASGIWRGKAGGYNITERLEAGWPVRCDGDHHAVMGLATASLQHRLDAFMSGRRIGCDPTSMDQRGA